MVGLPDFLPADDPAYVITVFVESGGSGRSSAVPLFQRMTEILIKDDPLNAIP